MGKRLPPGPSAFMLARAMFDLSVTFVDFAKKYGDPFTVPLPFGATVITYSPEGNKAIFSAEPDTFVSTGADILKGLLDLSVLATSGAQHKRQRKLLMPPFHGARMRAYGRLMRERALDWAGRIERGSPFVMVDVAQNITLDVIIEAVFGVDSRERMQEFRQAILAMLDAFSPLALMPQLRFRIFGLSPFARLLRRVERLQELVNELCREFRAAPAGREDILSLLLSAKDEDGSGLSDKEIFDQLLTLIVAGHETTAVMLAWAFYCLHQSPEQLARLHEELAPHPADADPEVIARLPFLSAVIDETLRLYPPVHIIHRRLQKPLSLGGYALQPGDNVAAGAFVTHRLESLYPEPERFLPQRFLDRSYSPFEYMPFGGGARRCLGAAFATYEMKQVLFALLSRYRFECLETGPVGFVHRPGTVGPKGGIRMRLLAETAP